MLLHTAKGDLIAAQKLEQTQFGARSCAFRVLPPAPLTACIPDSFSSVTDNGHRGEIHKIIWDHALSLGVDIRCGSDVTSFWEDDERCGVICNGERIEADVVVGADGVRSNARKLVLVGGDPDENELGRAGR